MTALDTAAAVILYGLGTSGIYALMAVGVALIYGVGRVINFAHGAFYTLGGYLTYILATFLGFPWYLAGVTAVALVGLMGAAFDRYVIGAIRDREITVWILTFATAFLVREGLVLLLGARPYSIPAFAPGSSRLLGQSIANQRLLIVAASFAALALLWLLLYRTRFGKSLRAVAQTRSGAYLVGIPVERAHASVMGISAALAALAGILISPISVVTPDMGFEPLLLSFTVVIFGGIGSLKGSLVAALIMGYISTLVSFLLSPQLVTFSALATVFLVLLVWPTGLFGMAAEEA